MNSFPSFNEYQRPKSGRLELLETEDLKAVFIFCFLPSDILKEEEQKERYWRVNESGCGLVLKWQERATSSGYYWARSVGRARMYGNEVSLIAVGFNEKLQAQDLTNFFYVQDDLSAWLSSD